jgi:hypothetical protein
MKNDSPTITCSAIEATFLASLLGGNVLVGLQDPFFGWLTEEIEQAWTDAKKSLAGRKYIALEEDGRIVVDTAVAALVGTWTKPEASFIFTFTPAEEKAQVRYFHLTRHLAVEQTLAKKSHYQLTALENARAVYRRILEILALQDQSAAGTDGIALLEKELMQVRAHVAKSGVRGAAEVLKKSDLKEAALRPLAHTLAKPIANSALVALAQRTTAWEVAGLGLLEGKNGLWRLRAFKRDGENCVEAIPCSASHARAQIRKLMNRVLPEPLAAG